MQNTAKARTGAEEPLATDPELDAFLAGVERRALRMAEFATGSRDEALDIVQEAMFTLARRYRLRAATDWAPLFQRILQNRIRDWYRRSRVRNRWRVWFHGSDDDDEHDHPLTRRPDPQARLPEDLLAGERFGAALENALRRLPLRQQQAFLLRAWEGLDVAATAAAMVCSDGSVKTHYSRALHALRMQLGDHGP